MSSGATQTVARPASSFERPQPTSPAKGASCRNCGSPLLGPHCSECGQRDVPLEPTLRELVADAWDAFVNVDGKVLRSIRLLLLRPGQLTREYLAGRRASFLPPLRVYLACSILFFLADSALPGSPTLRVNPSREPQVAGVQDPDSPIDSIAGVAGPEYSRRVQRGLRRAFTDGARFQSIAREQLPRVVFAMMPVYALLLSIAYRSRRHRYPYHLVFALHAHAFVFAALLLGRMADALPETLSTVAEVATVLWILAYVAVSLRTVYGGRWTATIGRMLAVGAVYSVVSLVAFGILIIGTLYAMGAPV